jgi:hypothetical integral membrane protein (TIGR02206 family)
VEPTFHPYGLSHLAALAVLVTGIVLIARHRDGTGRRFERRFALAIAAVAVPLQVLQFTPAEWSLDTSLPLQLCDWAWVVAAVALWTRWRLAATITYLWGLTLTMQGIVTPELQTAFPGLRWWMFWAMHLLIVWAAVHLVWSVRIHPTWRTYKQTVAITLGWLVLTFDFNVLAGTNYGYLNEKPKGPTILDLLGPWPFYLLVEIAVAASVWALLVWPWIREHRTSGRHRAQKGEGSMSKDVSSIAVPMVGGDEVAGDIQAEREE